MKAIDVTFQMTNDTKPNKDPDTYSQTLNNYHKMLWEKPLPDGTFFSFSQNATPPFYLSHSSHLGEFRLSSDSIVHTLSKWKQTAHFIHQVNSQELDNFYNLALTIAGFIIFPANKIDNKPTMNIIRGMHPWIRDRFDLTLECIRLWYQGKDSPLYTHISRYQDFFNLFLNFENYMEFFLLQDLMNDDGTIKYWYPFREFGEAKKIPQNLDEYNTYMKNVVTFLHARNQRINNLNVGKI